MHPERPHNAEHNALGDIETFLDQEETATMLLTHVAQELEVELSYYMAYTAAEIATEEERTRHKVPETQLYDLLDNLNDPSGSDNLAGLYNPDVPTIAIEYGRSFSGAALLGVVAAEQHNANVLFFTSETNCGNIVEDREGRKRFALNRAIMAAADGAVFVGKLPMDLTANAVYSNNGRTYWTRSRYRDGS